MKILHVLTQLPSKTGSGVYFTNLIDSLNKIGIENAAIYGTEAAFENKVETSLKYEMAYNTEEVPFHICGMSDEMPYESTIYGEMTEDQIDIMLAAFEKRLRKMKEDFQPDIVIAHHLFLLTDLVRRVFREEKVVGISHGTDIRQILKHEKFLKRLENLKDLDLVLTVTPAEDEAIEKLLGIDKEKIHLVGGGYNQDVFYPIDLQRDYNKIKIMYAGKITESKGIFALASALCILEKDYPNLEVHIVGNASESDKKRLEEKSCHSKNLHIYNAKDQKIMADFLKKSDIFVLPSYFEALGLIAIEALACNKLVVSSEIQGLKNLLGQDLVNSGIIEFVKLPRLYDVDKPVEEDLAAYEKRLAETIKNQIQKLDQNIFTKEIQEQIKNYSWENIGKRIFEIITEN